VSPPSRLSEFITLIRERVEDAARDGEAPALVTSSGVRPFIHPRVQLKTVGGI
jgi:flagellar biosynthesis protein FlhA